jgi:hypothetical protein
MLGVIVILGVTLGVWLGVTLILGVTLGVGLTLGAGTANICIVPEFVVFNKLIVPVPIVFLKSIDTVSKLLLLIYIFILILAHLFLW